MLPLTSGLGVAVPEHLGADLLTLSPAILVFLVAIVIILWEAVARPPDKRLLMGLSLVAVLVSLGLVTTVQAGAEGTGFSGMLAFDAYGTFFNLVFLISAGLSILISHDYLERIGLRGRGYYALALFSLSGMMLMGMGNDLILLFVALEVMSLGLYVMAAMQRTVRAVESGFKYFIMGAFASGILLYGIAFIYGDTGTTNLHGIRDAVAAGHTTGMLMIGVSLIMVGFCFKVAAVPFHMWAPDVYEGAPASVTGYMATGVKAASFAAFGRVLFVAFLDVKDDWTLPLWLIAAATMLLGNIAALVQVDLKRMLAYSSIAHAGYMLMALVAVDGSSAGANPQVSGLLFYLLAYTFMTLGAFAVLTLMAERGRDLTSVEHLVGLARRNPLLAAGLALCLLSLAGIPPTMGFVGKFYLFAAAVRGRATGLAIVGAVSGAIGVYYHLRPIVYMYMRDDREPLAVQPGAAVASALGIASLAILAFGLFPGQLIDLCRQGVASLAG